MSSSIVLYDSQKNQINQLKSIFATNKAAFDLSQPGAGKSYTSCAIARDYFKHCVVVAPLSVCVKFEEMKKKYKLNIRMCISFSSVKGVKNKKFVKHGLLYRHDITDIDGNTSVVFEPTERFKQLVSEGLLLVIDEIQNIKNDHTTQFVACKTLANYIEGASRLLLISGSPIDKKEQALTMFRTMGVYTLDVIAKYDLNAKTYVWVGMQQIDSYCSKLDPVRYAAVRALPDYKCEDSDISKKKLITYAYDLLQKVVFPNLSSTMCPPKSDSKLEKFNGFFDIIHPGDSSDLVFAVDKLLHASKYSSSKNGEALCAIQHALGAIEAAKMSTFVRLLIEKLDSAPGCKVAVFVNYTKSIECLDVALAHYNPLVMDGKTSKERRGEVMSLYSQPSLQHRVLIGNLATCNSGVDFDDKHGSFPRYAFVSPNYSSIMGYQLSFRFMRADTRSDTRITFVYGAVSPEVKILDALSKKTEVMKETGRAQIENGVLFPGDHPHFVEPGAEEDYKRFLLENEKCEPVSKRQKMDVS